MTIRLAALVLAATTGCATLFASGPAQIPVATNPPGAIVYVNGAPVGQTPTLLMLDSDLPANVQIYLPGYQPVQMWRQKSISGWFWVNLLFWPGFIVDLATGNYQRYRDDGIAIGLVPSSAPPPEWHQPPPSYQPPPPSPAPVQPGGPYPPAPATY